VVLLRHTLLATFAHVQSSEMPARLSWQSLSPTYVIVHCWMLMPMPRTTGAIGARHGEFAVVRRVAVADEQNAIQAATVDDDLVDVHARHARTVDTANARAVAVVRAAGYR